LRDPVTQVVRRLDSRVFHQKPLAVSAHANLYFPILSHSGTFVVDTRCFIKKIVIIAAVVVVLIVVVSYFLLSNLNSIVAAAIEKKGSEVTQTDVSVSGVEIALRDGRGSIKGLRIANPDKFQAPYAFSLEGITLDIDIKSLSEDPVVIEEIRIQTPIVIAEIAKTGASNIEELRKRVQAYTAGSSGESGESDGPAKRIRIEQFIFEKGSIEVDASALGIEKRAVALPEIRLSNVGGADGAPSGEIAKILLAALAGKAASEVAGSELNRLIEEKLDGSITDKAKKLLEKIGN
jgi:uncharacterized protein involved in outer membrane biogenesis